MDKADNIENSRVTKVVILTHHQSLDTVLRREEMLKRMSRHVEGEILATLSAKAPNHLADNTKSRVEPIP
eukprot:snap_masked-scaffold_28-processed-gene-2.20-mRNA-1 protein AED:1.00 eAED:1.00 QI:0/0/0/0/1/1/2/0/69